MEISRVYGGSSNMLDMLESSNPSLWVSTPSPSFHETMLTFDQESNQGKRPRFKRDYCDNVDDLEYEEFDTNPNKRGKKRRLSPEQVEYLEKSFEIENKLEPERKLELAKELGLQPRQVAIWFQNRRARYKTKQLEKDYCSLKSSYDRLVLDFDALSKERNNLHNEVKALTKKLKEKDASKHNVLMNKVQLEKEIPKLEIEEMDKTGLVVVPNSNMQSVEETNSAKSDIVDSESPHCTDGNHSSLMENPFDQQSDYSPPPDESDYLNMSKRLLLPSTLPPPPPPPLPAYNNYLKVEDNGFYDTNESSCNFSLVEEQPFWSMLY